MNTDLDLVTDVDNNGVSHRGHVDPLPGFFELETADLVVLEEQDDATGVSVGPQALEQLWPRASRVVADLGAEIRSL